MKVWIAYAALVTLGCGGGTEPNGPADNRGVFIAEFPEIEDLTWSTDGTELYFIEGAFRIRAASPNAGGSRILHATDVRFGHIATAANKVWASVAANSAGTASRVLRIDPGNGDVDTLLFRSGVGTFHIAVSHDERFVAYGDTLYDLVMTTRRALPRGTPWSFSPDGSQLLYELKPASGLPTLVLFATGDLSTQEFTTPDNIAGRTPFSIGAHYWDGNDPKFLRVERTADLAEAFITDALSGEERQIAEIDNAGLNLGNPAAISADGSRMGIWLRTSRWEQMHSVETDAAESTIVATVVSVFALVNVVLLSPDGSRAAYRVNEGGTFTGESVSKVYVAGME
jgi:hypothetical protein